MEVEDTWMKSVDPSPYQAQPNESNLPWQQQPLRQFVAEPETVALTTYPTLAPLLGPFRPQSILPGHRSQEEMNGMNACPEASISEPKNTFVAAGPSLTPDMPWTETSSHLLQEDMKNIKISEVESIAPPKPPSQQATKSNRLSKNDRKWDAHKDEIYRLYILEDNTLEATMQKIEAFHCFKASPRKWKDKLKEWTFDKYLGTESMKILVAKAEKRKREEDKETVFYHRHERVTEERIETFKKKKLKNETDAMSPSADTPSNVTYYTPRSDPATSPELKQSPQSASLTPAESVSEAFWPVKIATGTTQAFAAQFGYPQTMGICGTTAESHAKGLEAEIAHNSIEEHTICASQSPDIPGSIENPQDTEDVANEELATTITSATAKLLYEQGLNFKTDEKWNDAESHLLRSVEQFEQVEGADSFNALQALSLLADVYQAQDQLSKSITTYHNVVTGREIIFGESSLESALSSFTFAKLQKENGDFVEALSWSRKALVVYEDRDLKEEILECHFFRASLYRALDDNDEAEKLLHFVFTRCLELGWKVLLIAIVEAFRKMQVSLVLVNRSMSHRSILAPRFSNLLDLLHKEKSDAPNERNLAPEQFDYANLLFSLAHLRIKDLRNRQYGKQKAQSRVEFAVHCQRQELWGQCVSHLRLALRGFRPRHTQQQAIVKDLKEALDRKMWFEDDAVLPDVLEDHIEQMRLLLWDKEPVIPEAPRLESRQEWGPGWEELGEISQRRAEVSMKATSDINSISTGSHKYGVTYAISEITGISDSIFMAA